MSAGAAAVLEYGVLVVDAALVSWFLCRLTGVRPRVAYAAGYLGLSLLLNLVFAALPAWDMAGWAVQQCISLAAVCLFVHFALGAVWPTALAATSILLVCNALFSQMGALLTYALWDTPFPGVDLLLLLAVHGARLAAFIGIVRTLGDVFTGAKNRYLHLFLLPCALLTLLFADSFYVLVGSLGSGGGDSALLVRATCTVVLATASFGLVLYAFARAGHFIQAEHDRGLLAQEVQNQRQYVQEAQRRSEESRAVQHDMHNHLLVLAGLLEKADAGSAINYLQKPNATVAETDPLPRTGSAAADVLLAEKLAAARRLGIAVECHVRLPREGGPEEFDLCVVLANALDNALHACAALPAGTASLTVRATQRKGFLLLEITNTALPGPATIEEGTGLGNIRRVAAKYGGTVEIGTGESDFRLAVLLCMQGGGA